jgi:hypothetical protein
MQRTVTIRAIVDLEGRIVGAQLAEQTPVLEDQEEPSVELLPLDGQRVISVDVPAEVLELPGPDLQRFFSHLEISWPAEVRLPKIEIRRHGEG